MFRTLRTFLLLADATLKRIPLATKIHFMLVCGDRTNSCQKIVFRLFAASTLGFHRPTTAFIVASVMFSCTGSWDVWGTRVAERRREKKRKKERKKEKEKEGEAYSGSGWSGACC